jgi:hypothetical protein
MARYHAQKPTPVTGTVITDTLEAVAREGARRMLAVAALLIAQLPPRPGALPSDAALPSAPAVPNPRQNARFTPAT